MEIRECERPEPEPPEERLGRVSRIVEDLIAEQGE
jgi:hypothetical protein